MMPVWLLFILVALTVARVTRLVTRDHFPASVAFRGRVVDRWGSEAWQAWLVECDWCLSVWVSAGVTAATAFTVGIPAPFLVWPAASAVTGLIATMEPD